jgi:hypothetical protein
MHKAASNTNTPHNEVEIELEEATADIAPKILAGTVTQAEADHLRSLQVRAHGHAPRGSVASAAQAVVVARREGQLSGSGSLSSPNSGRSRANNSLIDITSGTPRVSIEEFNDEKAPTTPSEDIPGPSNWREIHKGRYGDVAIHKIVRYYLGCHWHGVATNPYRLGPLWYFLMQTLLLLWILGGLTHGFFSARNKRDWWSLFNGFIAGMPALTNFVLFMFPPLMKEF